ncbi:hypothetical protein EDM53_03105 [Rickettsiales endosymbiont of Peranema trichophorum]|uniref:hypothetical protein n=1 Tax=Rickettsiales endosymbiont of Peranema trichophorum TaxID=2486577 RepID=UPI001023956B|nr:hypothetical protein [Rickettsiales endosymbiont of Peranema trichophorum]RZI47205.1 hypothetical protein EDM53_03105 [Rickettsiales endosymbiont of Peranema trichophorum]
MPLLILLMCVLFIPVVYADEIPYKQYKYVPTYQELQYIETFQDWQVYRDLKDPYSCYAISVPYRTKGVFRQRNTPFFGVVYRGTDQYSLFVYQGFEVDSHKNSMIQISDRNHMLTTQAKGFASTSSSVQDVELINDIIENQDYLNIRSVDTSSNVSVDFYSLKGFTSAVNFLNTSCFQ